MAIKATEVEKKVFDPVPEGSHMARLYQIIEIGTVPGYEGALQKKIRLVFELPNETKEFKEGEGEKPFSIGKDYTLSMHEKANLRKVVEGMIGTSLKDEEAYAFDVESLVGKECMLTVKQKDRKQGDGKFAFIDGVAPVPKGAKVPKQVNESKVLSYENWDKDFFDSLPSFLKDMIKASQEFQDKFGDKGLDF